MTTYNTGNAVPSADARDRFDNSQTFDEVINGTLTYYANRIGNNILSLKGMTDLFTAAQLARSNEYAADKLARDTEFAADQSERATEFETAQDDREVQFNYFLSSSGFELPYIPYVDGAPLVVDRATQLVERTGDLYSVRLPASFPYSLTGNWAIDQTHLVLRNDQEIRQDLAEPATGGSIVGYQHPGVGAAISNAKAKFGLMYVTPQDFDPSVGYGVTDAGAAVQKALNYLATVGGGELVYPPGNYKHITTPKLPVNLPNDLRISCYGANLIAVAGGRIFDVNKVADHDTLQNIEICGANIDFTAMTGRNHVIAGTYVNGTIQTRINFKNNTIRDIRGIGPAPDPTLVNHVICLYFQCAHPTSREATRGFVDGTRLINVKMVGGNAGYLVLGNSLASSDAPNISMDTVSVIDCEHKVTVAPEAFFASSSLHIGLDAIVKSVLVDNFYGENPGDNGIEINNVRSANIRLARIKNPQNVAYYIDNKNPDFDSTSQIITYDTCIGDHAGYGSRTFQVGPYVTDGSGGSEVHGNIGQVNYINCGSDFTVKGPTAGGYAINGGLSGKYLYDSINVENYKVTAAYDTTLTSSQFPAAFTFRSSGPSRVMIDGVEWKLSGTIVQGGFIFRPRLVNLFGPDLMCSLTGVRGVLNFSGVTDTFRLISLELGKATVFARNNKVVSSSPCTMLYLNVPDGLDSTHKAILSDSDWSGAGAVLAAVAGGTDQFRFARVKDVQVASPLGMVILGSGASPRTITNFVGYQQQIFVSGGTGVSIELDGGTGVFVSTGQSAGGFMLSAGQSIRVTYTTAPTVAVAHLGT